MLKPQNSFSKWTFGATFSSFCDIGIICFGLNPLKFPLRMAIFDYQVQRVTLVRHQLLHRLLLRQRPAIRLIRQLTLQLRTPNQSPAILPLPWISKIISNHFLSFLLPVFQFDRKLFKFFQTSQIIVLLKKWYSCYFTHSNTEIYYFLTTSLIITMHNMFHTFVV